jgi:hypothetical protein
MELTVVLMNPAPGGCRGESCACLGAALRVVAWELPVRSSSVRWLKGAAEEGRRMHNSRCGGVSSSRASTSPGMVLQCPGWWHSGKDGRTGPKMTEETRSTGPTSRHRPVGAKSALNANHTASRTKLASHAQRAKDVPVNFSWKLTKDKAVRYQSLELVGWYQTVPYLRLRSQMRWHIAIESYLPTNYNHSGNRKGKSNIAEWMT